MASEPKKDRHPPGSFDSLVAGMDGEFKAIEAEVDKMKDKLEKADQQSESLEKRLVEGATGRQHG